MAVATAKQEETPMLILDVGAPLRTDHKDIKFTVPVRKEFFSKLLKNFNISRACAELGVSNTAVYDLMERDGKFKQSMQEVKNYWLDSCEGNGLKVACQPAREGFNDRKFFLESHRPALYGKKTEVNLNHNISIKSAHNDIKELLHEFNIDKSDSSEETEDIDFTELTGDP